MGGTAIVLVQAMLPGCAPPDATAEESAAGGGEGESTEDPVVGNADELRSRVDGYNLSEPLVDLELPKKLAEISGLVAMEDGTLACIQDERGTVYLIDGASGEVSSRVKFAGKDDFEAICRAGSRWFALISDGEIVELEETDGKEGFQLEELDSIEIDLPHAEFEALAHDALGDRLLLVPKDRADSKARSKDDVLVYALGLGRLAGDPEIALELSVKRIEESAAERRLPLPTRTTKSGKKKSDLRLRASDLAVHPATGHLYLLSGPDRTLLVLDRDGALIGSAVFPASLLPQPEGVAFAEDGRLILTSEGVDGGRARLLAFPLLPR
ncbi:MAG: SdiA-regulated domain-containing protein [Planctomycetota bacterium]